MKNPKPFEFHPCPLLQVGHTQAAKLCCLSLESMLVGGRAGLYLLFFAGF